MRVLSISLKYLIWKFIWSGYGIYWPVSWALFCDFDTTLTYSEATSDNLQIHEEKTKGVYVKGLSDYYVGSAKEVYEIMRQGASSRMVTATSEMFHTSHRTIAQNPFRQDMNAESSRSHSIFLIAINQRNTESGAQKTGNMYLVDLAGSEKVGKTGASGQTLEEAKKINKSLSALGMVINALTDGKVGCGSV